MTEKASLATYTQRLVIALCLILGAFHIITLGFTFQRRTATRQLDADRLVLEENLNQLRDINQEELDQAQAELDSLRAENALLEESFPELGAPFALYRRIKDLADQNTVNLASVNLLGSEIIDTVSGPVIRKQYSIEAYGTLDTCLGLIQTIENAGLDTVTMQTMDIQPEENLCSLVVNTLGYTQNSE